MINKSLNLEYISKIFLKNRNKNKNIIEELIIFFEEIIHNYSLTIEEFEKLSKEDMLLSFIVLFIIRKKINWFQLKNFEIEGIENKKDNLFQLIIKIDIEKNLFFSFKNTNYENVLFLTSEEAKAICKKRNNFIIFNSFYDKNNFKIIPINSIDFYNLYKVKSEKWKVLNPDCKEIGDAYISKENYNNLKKELKKKAI